MSKSRRFVFYLRESGRNIVITDKSNDESKVEISKRLSEVLTSQNVVKFETDSDILIVRPHDIIGIQVTDESFKNDPGNIDIDIDEVDTELSKEMRVIPDLNLEDIDHNLPDLDDITNTKTSDDNDNDIISEESELEEDESEEIISEDKTIFQGEKLKVTDIGGKKVIQKVEPKGSSGLGHTDININPDHEFEMDQLSKKILEDETKKGK